MERRSPSSAVAGDRCRRCLGSVRFRAPTPRRSEKGSRGGGCGGRLCGHRRGHSRCPPPARRREDRRRSTTTACDRKYDSGCYNNYDNCNKCGSTRRPFPRVKKLHRALNSGEPYAVHRVLQQRRCRPLRPAGRSRRRQSVQVVATGSRCRQGTTTAATVATTGRRRCRPRPISLALQPDFQDTCSSASSSSYTVSDDCSCSSTTDTDSYECSRR